jgi:ACDE family multidrug resistance protein
MQFICAVAMSTFGGTALVSPILPVIQDALNVETESIGWVVAAFSLPGIIFIPLTGILSDRYGRRAVMTPLLFLYGIAGGLTFLAPNFETLLVLRFLSGIGASSLGSLTIVLVGDMFEKKDRAAALGYRIALGQTASGVLPILAGFIAIFGWQYPFLLYFLAVPLGFVALSLLEKQTERRSVTDKAYLGNLWRAIANPRTATLLTIAPTLMIVNQGITVTFIPLFMSAALDASAATIGIILSARVVTSIIGATQLGRLTNTFSAESLVIASIIGLVLSVASVPFVSSIWVMLIPSLAIGLTTGVAFPAFQSLLVQETPDHARAAVISTNGVNNRLGQVLGPVLGGVLFGIGGFDLVFFAAGGFLVVMFLFLYVSLRLNPLAA